MGRGLGEGACRKRRIDGDQHPLQICPNLSVREPNHLISLFFQPSRALSVITRLASMAIPVNLDHKSPRTGGEVSNVATDHDLTGEFHALESLGA